jgi:hypothetical protein
MTATMAQSKVTFVIDLPQLVGRATFKALIMLGGLSRCFANQTVPVQDTGDRASSRHLSVPQIQQPTAQFARTPGRMFLA